MSQGDYEGLTRHGAALFRQGRREEAYAVYRDAVFGRPDFAPAHSNLAAMLIQLGKVPEAIAAAEKAVALDATFVEAHTNLGAALSLQGELTAAIQALRQAIAVNPHQVVAWSNLGNALRHQGRLAEAADAYRRALLLDPNRAVAHSNLLCCLNYDARETPASLFAAHQGWAAAHAPPPDGRVLAFSNAPDPDRRLRIGYVSGDFHQHSVSYFFEPLITAHDRFKVEVFCYSNGEFADATSARLKALTDHWVSIRGVDTETVAARIRADGIDVLVDLGGHTDGGRLDVFARKPAPIQVTWLGYPHTTGMAAVDYRITDAIADPEGDADRLHTEKLVRLPHSFLCYRPLDDAPPVAELPARQEGFITFGSFNNTTKVTDATAAVWARILHAIPGSRLKAKAIQLSDSETAAEFRSRFGALGIVPERLDVLPRLSGQAPAQRDPCGFRDCPC